MGAIEELVEHLQRVYVDQGGKGCLADGSCPTCERLLPLVEAELAAGEERVVEVRHDEGRLHCWTATGEGTNIHTQAGAVLFPRTPRHGQHRYAIRRLPDSEPERVVVWEIPKQYLLARSCPYLCGRCAQGVTQFSLGDKCPRCDAPLAHTPTPWEERSDG